MSLANVIKRLNELGCVASADGEQILLDVGTAQVSVHIDGEWRTAIQSYYKARQYKFDPDRRVLTANRSAEFHVIRLDPGFFYRVTQTFTDPKGNKVALAPASKEYKIAYFESARYEKTFERIKERIERRASSPVLRRRGHASRPQLRIEDLFFNFHTVTYSSPRKPRRMAIDEVALEPIKACLFALSYRKNESWELSHEIKARGMIYPRADDDREEDLEIPRAAYDDAAVTFYKVAKSSHFPSQVFLAYYHILEFHFLRVADESLFNAVCAQLNNPDFRSTYENVTRLLAAIKRNDNTSSETQMLLGVLRKFVAEEEFIEFVEDFEGRANEKLFTKANIPLFGERYYINLNKGHALSSAATIIKHIRNALVHSSDKYAREDCFIPLSEAEDHVVKYIPIVQFMAERVIFATAKRDL